ncbi:MAG: hypothetical protein WCF04_05000 [Candidatus Nanopelagicales bacterium]
MLTQGAATAAALVLAAALASPAAAAGDSGGNSGIDVDFDSGANGSNGGATVNVGAGYEEDESGSAGGGGAGSTSGGGRSDTRRTCTFRGEPIDCTHPSGVWSNDRQCWVQRESSPPPKETTVWDNHTDGAIYRCTPPFGAQFGGGGTNVYLFWAPSAGADGAPVLVDPVALAEEAVERMGLTAPTVGMTPLRVGAPLLVGMDAWLWVADPGPQSYGPISRTATAGPVSVTATAQVAKVVWNLGDGSRVTCRNAGTPWTPDQGTGASPTCGHRYTNPSTTQPGGVFQVRATAHWQVDWSGAGQSGQITFTLTGTRDVPVTEVQVLQTH